MFSRNTAHLMILQKDDVMSSFNQTYYRLTSFGTLVMKLNYFLPFRFGVCLIGGQLGRFCSLLIKTELS